MNPEEPCPCDPCRRYAQCCGPYHTGAFASDAETLMRSRYSAFVKQLDTYLLDTWHPSTRPASIEFNPHQKWLGLTIKDAQISGSSRSEVEFIARYRIGGSSAARLHERSRFVHEDGRWFYVDGEIKPSK